MSEAAALLHTSEAVLGQQAREGAVPHQFLAGQYWFNRAELLEWANEHGAVLSIRAFPDHRRGQGPAESALGPALGAGGVHPRVAAGDRDSLIAAIAARLPVPEPSDRVFLRDVMMVRERLGSTGVGDGIAIPHARAPVVFAGAGPSISVCYLARPVEFFALDGQPIHTVFAMVTLTVRGHLALLARLSAALHDPGFRAAVLGRADAPALLAEAARIDAALDAPSSGL